MEEVTNNTPLVWNSSMQQMPEGMIPNYEEDINLLGQVPFIEVGEEDQSPTIEVDIDDNNEDLFILDVVPFKGLSNGKFNNKSDFVKTIYTTFQKVLSEKGLDPRYAKILTASAALESGWGKSVSGTFNYGGVKGKNGSVKKTRDFVNGKYIFHNQSFRDFLSVEDYCGYLVNLVFNTKRYKHASLKFSANEPFDFWRSILDSGYGGGDNAGKTKYINSLKFIYRTINLII